MRCSKCGIEDPAGTKFCGDCGAPLANVFLQCGSDNPAGKRFCAECGAALAWSPAASAKKAPAPIGDATAPLAHHLAEKIRQSKSVLEGERKQVTVLFADVKGSMELAEQMDPEEWTGIMQRFFKILAEGVERFEGYVDKFTGDGIMALFGALIAREDHARRARYAALQIVDGLSAYANELRLRRGLNFSVRLGLNSGEVIVGKIGDDLRMDYTAQGHTVELASRMEQIAEPGKVCITARTASLVEGYFALAYLGEMEINGVHDLMHVFELQGLRQMRTWLNARSSRTGTPATPHRLSGELT